MCLFTIHWDKIYIVIGDILASTGILNGNLNASISGIGCHRIGIAYNAVTGVFSITGSNGFPLGVYNPGYVSLSSTATPGKINTYTVVADQSFIDDTGASDIAGNSFQTGGSLWASPMPFYIYAVQNSAETAVNFSICRLPHITIAPAAAKCAKKASAVADVQYAMFFLGDPVVADFASQNCVCLGSIMMTKTTASHDWTVSPIAQYDGIGRFKIGYWCSMPLAANGCGATLPPAGSSFIDSGANTAPLHANLFLYKIGLDGICYMQIALAVGTLGAGGAALLACQPFEYSTAGALLVNSSAMYKANPGNAQTEYFPYMSDPYISFCTGKGSTSSLTNAAMAAGSQLFTQFQFPIRSNYLAGGSV